MTSAMRCPSCGATLRPDAPWCTLCYADLRSAATPVEAPLPSPPDEAVIGPQEELAAAEAPPLPLTDPSWPCTRCAAVNPFSESACVACGARFLAGVRETEKPLLVLPVVGDVEALSRGQRLALAAGIVFVILGLLALVTFLMTHSPPANAGSSTVPTSSMPKSDVP